MAAAGFCAGAGSARSSDRDGNTVIPASLAGMALPVAVQHSGRQPDMAMRLPVKRCGSSNHGHSAAPSWVTAPPGAWPTSRAYLASAPARCRGGRGFQALPPLREFAVVDQQIHAARAGIDPDAVAVAHQRQRTADEGFRRDIADAHAARRAGEASVGDQRDLLAHPLPVDQRGDAEHLAHAGTADRTLVADDQHLAGGIVAVADGIDAALLVLEHARGAFEHQALQAGDLDDGAIGAEIALQHRDAAVRHDRLAGRER